MRDGDTIEVAGVPIRLNGLAAPESGDPGGRTATVAMRRMVDGHQARCELNGERTYDRCVGICYLGGKDIATELVRQGGTVPGTAAGAMPRPSAGRGRGHDDPDDIPIARVLSLKRSSAS